MPRHTRGEPQRHHASQSPSPTPPTPCPLLACSVKSQWTIVYVFSCNQLWPSIYCPLVLVSPGHLYFSLGVIFGPVVSNLLGLATMSLTILCVISYSFL